MNRRSFVKTVAMTGGSAVLLHSTPQMLRANVKDRPSNIIVNGLDPTWPSEQYLEMLKQGGVGCWHVSVGDSLQSLSLFHSFLDKHSDKIELAKSVKDIHRIYEEGKIAVVVRTQSAESLADPRDNDWVSNPPKISLRAYYELGMRIVNLIYNMANRFAGGCLNPQIGLSKSGRYLVTEMQKMGILVDCGGHTGERASLDITEMAERPVVCTHSNVAALNDNPRCTSDRVIERIAKTGGVFGVTAISSFMIWGPKTIGKKRKDLPKVTISRMIDEFDYLKKLVGVDHIGLGPDFTHGAHMLIDPEHSFIFPPEMSYRHQPIEYIEGFEDITKLPNVERKMRERGWKDDEIRKVFGENWLRVYEQAWGA
jgi:membrane dipeptidase